MTRLQVRLNLGILDLKHEAQLARCRVSLLDDLVAGTSDFDRSPRENLRHRRGRGAKRLVSVGQRKEQSPLRLARFA